MNDEDEARVRAFIEEHMTQIAGAVLGGLFDMAVRARATHLAHFHDWSPEDEYFEDLAGYEERWR